MGGGAGWAVNLMMTLAHLRVNFLSNSDDNDDDKDDDYNQY